MGRKEGGELKWRNNFPGWVADCTRKHQGKYQYTRSFERELDTNGRWVVPIECPEHGEFLQAPRKHRFGQGCPACAGIILHNPLQKLREAFPEQVFPNEWAYGSKERFTLTCPEHGEFVTYYNQLMHAKAVAGSKACPKCNIESRGKKIRLGPHEIGARLHTLYPEYLFALEDNQIVADKFVYVCPSHGVKESKGQDMLRGHGCPDCGQQARNDGIYEARGCTPLSTVIDIGIVHGGRYIPHFKDINRTHEKVRVTCVDHGPFDVLLYSLKAGHGCPKCSHRVSRAEIALSDWLRSSGVEVEQQGKDILEMKGSLDIYLPEHGVAIEYTGLYWHQEKFKGRTAHYNKLKDAAQAGVRLITIFEDEWEGNPEVVKKVLSGILQMDKASVFARNTQVRSATWSEVREVYVANHLQGAGSPCKENYVLISNGVVVSAMSFRRDRFGSNTKELVRYAFNTRVVGGFNKLLKAFLKAQDEHGSLVSYSDKRWFLGDTYNQAGFSRAGETGPGYWWCKASARYSRIKFQKHKLKDILPVFDPNLTEEENMIENKYWKIWDCGMDRWVLTY